MRRHENTLPGLPARLGILDQAARLIADLKTRSPGSLGDARKFLTSLINQAKKQEDYEAMIRLVAGARYQSVSLQVARKT